MSLRFPSVIPRHAVDSSDWGDWKWQFKNSLKTQDEFASYFELSLEEQEGFRLSQDIFRAQTTPYYASIASRANPLDPVRLILMPRSEEALSRHQEMLDPLGERKPENHKTARVLHRYSDRVLFLLTDLCSVYCRYCTRKHFTANDNAVVSGREFQEAIDYISRHPGIREVIFSGGDPLTVSDGILERALSAVRKIPHIEVIRVHSRMPVVAPMRITDDLVRIFQKNKPVYLITHFNHPDEITAESASAVEKLVDHGVPVLNQMVLLNGINNHPALIQALSRRLLYLRVKPYYMFQCDPSEGSDHLRTSIEDSLQIQRELWGHLSGLAMPTYIVDLPNGGGKTAMTPNFETGRDGNQRFFTGWDGVSATYTSPTEIRKPWNAEKYIAEWELLKNAKTAATSSASDHAIDQQQQDRAADRG